MRESVFFSSKTVEDKVLTSCHSLIAAFFPGKKIVKPDSMPDSDLDRDSSGLKLSIEHSHFGKSVFDFELSGMYKDRIIRDKISVPESLGDLTIPGKESLFQIQVKQAVVLFLNKYTGQTVPWGILTGIRPGKLIQRMNLLNLTTSEQAKILKGLYLVREDKTSLLQSVAKVQQPFLRKMESRPELAALYISIPFCPSRCYYCSFPSNNPTPSLLFQYMAVLEDELILLAKILREKGISVNTVYIGGGTPTVLGTKELDKLLASIRQYIPLENVEEFTVEAGRPDTIEENKLLVLKEYGVNRISINPQSMQDSTLDNIGRKHTVADVYKAYELARKFGDWIINMDLILGLPQEGLAEIGDSLERILSLKPDNLTVHSLAQKRGSQAWAENYNPGSMNYWLDIQKYVLSSIDKEGYVPYYLYRQKNIVGNLENIGYSLPEKECIYNIAIIEERQNIFGVGAGAATKILNKKEKNHQNIYHSVDIAYYFKGYKDINSKINRALES